MRSTAIVGLYVALTSLLACQNSSRADVAATQAAIDSVLALHARHAIAKDVEAMVNTYTEDAVVRSNHMEPLRGHVALRPFFTQLFAAVDVLSLKYTTEKLAVYGDSAWQVSVYELTVQPKGGVEQRDHGSAFVLWVRDASGTWRIQDDVVNSSVPLPTPATAPPSAPRKGAA